MNDKSEFEHVECEGIDGALLTCEKGIYFQPYISNEEFSKYFGDSMAIGATGVFGAVNMIKKLNEDNPKSPVDAARQLREHLSLEELLNKKVVKFYPWKAVLSIKDRKIMGLLEVSLEGGIKLKFRDHLERKSAHKLLNDHVSADKG